MTIRSEIQNQAQNTLLQYAIFRWENALILGLTIILTFLLPRPFFWWPRFGWLLLGLVAVGMIIYSSLKDAESNSKVLLKSFQAQFDPDKISDPNLRKDVESALEYQRRIETEIRQQKAGLMQDRLADTAGQISDWLGNVYQLAQRLDSYRKDTLLDRERETLPAEIDELSRQKNREHNPEVIEQLDRVIDTKGQHWQSVRALDTQMKQAELQLEQSISALATIYSQIRLIDAQDIASGRAERLQSDIQEQVARMTDLVSSVSEVYDSGSRL